MTRSFKVRRKIGPPPSGAPEHPETSPREALLRALFFALLLGGLAHFDPWDLWTLP